METKHARVLRQAGFSMVELLMVAFILAIGLLGLASLQTMSLTQGLTGRQRGTAAILAHSLLDQIQAEGALSSAERSLSPAGTHTSSGFTFIEPAGAAPTAAAMSGPSYTILGLTDTDPYYIAHPTADKTIVFTTSWVRRQGTINTYSKTGIQEFTVNVSWTEVEQGTPTPKYFSVSRYVRI